MYYVYILYSKNKDRLYKGSTSDLRERFRQHSKGEVNSTKTGIPWVILYYEAFVNKTDALREEKFLKSGRGRERLKYLLKETLK